MAYVKITFCLLCVMYTIVSAQLLQCRETVPCFPATFDLVERMADFPDKRSVEVSSTCGTPDTTTYHSFKSGDTGEYNCTAGQRDKENMYDRNTIRQTIGGIAFTETEPIFTTYWQSGLTVTSEGTNATDVTITVNATDVFLINEVSLYFIAPDTPAEENIDGRPSAMKIERLDDGAWRAWRYFADDCDYFPEAEVYDEAKEGTGVYNPTSVFCVTFDRNKPIPTNRDKNLHILELQPNLEFTTEFRTDKTIMQYFSTSAVRITLSRPGHMGVKKSYYAVADLKVDASCSCHGHASICSGDNENLCECGHNTEGERCERCLPLFNNKPWQIGVACEACNCNALAESCAYNETKGAGVCGDCRDNTAGEHCTECQAGYFVNPSQIPNATVTESPAGGTCLGFDGIEIVQFDCNRYCIACHCNAVGTDPDSNRICHGVSGQCTCKTNVQGRQCSECKDEYHSLTDTPEGCTACQCDPRGTLNSSNYCNKESGECVCKTNTEGSDCGSCKSQFYNLNATNVVDGCTHCGCDVGAAENNECNAANGQCTCRHDRLLGRDCRTVQEGFFIPKLDHFMHEAEFGNLTGATIAEEPGHGHNISGMTGLGYVELPAGGSVSMEIEIPEGVSGVLEVLIRYKATGPGVTIRSEVSLKGGTDYTCNEKFFPGTFKIGPDDVVLNGQVLKSFAKMPTTLCTIGNQRFDVTISSPETNANAVFIDSVVLLPVISDLQAYTTNADIGSKMAACREVIQTVDFVQRQVLNCSELEFSLMAEFAVPLPCDCNSTGTVPIEQMVCDPYGGQCTCKHGMILRACSVCQVDSYGGADASGCVACDCNILGSVNAFCDNEGKCDCKQNVTGQKCDVCIQDNFGLFTGAGCSLCQCNMDYSVNNTCSDSGQCPCKPGVGGLVCDQCADGFYNLSTEGCIQCECNQYGGVPSACDKTNGGCSCKANVQGDQCTECKQGFYGLGPWADQGCLPCYCSGHSGECTTAVDWYDTITESHWPLNEAEKATDVRWTGEDDAANAIIVDDPVTFQNNAAQYVMRIINKADYLNKNHLFFVAPEKFLGDKRTAYGRSLRIDMRTTSTENLLTGYTEGDVILEGSSLDFSLTRNLHTPPGVQITTNVLLMTEAGWFENNVGGNPATYQQMMETLSSLEALKIRGKFSNTLEAEVDVYQVVLEHATKANISTPLVNNVEICTCPATYRGDFCELCGFGFRREESNSGAKGSCVSCECNGHAGGECNAETGVCNCTHNTTGDRCDSCLPGFYGNPTTGQPDDCKPCTCPGSVPAGDDNVFSTLCVVNPDTLVGPRCTDCVEGHSGNECEVCINGFYGQPRNVSNNGGACVPCVCNNRALTCESETGVCVDCIENTGGKECDECASGFYSINPDAIPCEACNCESSLGATGDCNHMSGVCECKTNVVGPGCDTCAPDTYNITSGNGCSDCGCHANGSTSTSCNVETGECTCRSNVIGRQCDTCADGFWNLNPVTGCDPCECNSEGIDPTSDGKCEQESGQCTCQNLATIGRPCDACSSVSFKTYKHVSIFELGTFPNCGLCGECFDSWADRLEEIGDDIDSHLSQINETWGNYNRWKPKDADVIILSIRDNITVAESSIHRAGNFTDQLSSIQEQLQQISGRATVIDGTVNSSQTHYDSLQDQLTELQSFVGTVAIDNMPNVNVPTLSASTQGVALQIQERYQEGNESWQSIRELSILVGNSGEASQQLQSRVDAAMAEMKVATDTYNLMLKIFTESFQSGYQNNENALTAASDIIKMAKERLAHIQETLGKIETQHQFASSTVLAVSGDSEQQLDGWKLASENSSYTQTLAEAVLLDASNCLKSVNTYMTISTYSRINITSSFSDVIEGINALRDLITKLTQAKSDGEALRSIELRALTEIQDLSNQIGNTILDVDKVAETNAAANQALASANEAMTNTELARDKSQQAKEEVEAIKEAIDQAAVLRSNVSTLVQNSDQKNLTIFNVLSEVDNKATRISSLAQATKSSINDVNSFILTTRECFATTQMEANAAKAKAESVFKQANDSDDRLVDIEPIEEAIAARAALIDATAGLNLIESLNTDLQAVLSSFANVEGVTNLQALLQNYLEQRNEVEALENSLESLDADITGSLSQLEAKDAAAQTQCINDVP